MLKKTILALVLLTAGTFAAVAQSTQSPLFYESFSIIKIYSMQEGYRVIYRDPGGALQDLYVPISWFGTGTSKAVLISGESRSYPYFSIYWLNGKFDYIKLYVKASYDDPSWGILPLGFDATGKFPQNGTLTIQWH